MVQKKGKEQSHALIPQRGPKKRILIARLHIWERSDCSRIFHFILAMCSSSLFCLFFFCHFHPTVQRWRPKPTCYLVGRRLLSVLFSPCFPVELPFFPPPPDSGKTIQLLLFHTGGSLLLLFIKETMSLASCNRSLQCIKRIFPHFYPPTEGRLSRKKGGASHSSLCCKSGPICFAAVTVDCKIKGGGEKRG